MSCFSLTRVGTWLEENQPAIEEKAQGFAEAAAS